MCAEGTMNDNRHEVIAAAKKKLIDGTNIESSPDEMKVLDSFLFRCWQMGWLEGIERTLELQKKEPVPPPAEEYDEESGIVKFARSELKRLEDACLNDEALEMQRMVDEDIIHLIKVFGEQGHSGFSGDYALNLFKRLSGWLPASALTGEDDEWMDLSFITRDGKGKMTQQNKRYAGLFRDNHDNSTAHDIHDVVFSDNGGATWFSSNRIVEKGGYRKKITFPYMPSDTPRFVYLKYTKFDKDGNPEEDSWVDITGDEEEIKKLREAWEKTWEEEYHTKQLSEDAGGGMIDG